MECALGKNDVVKIFLFKDHVINPDSYLDILQNCFISQLEQLNLKHDTVFQQDRALWHFALRVRQFLNWKFLIGILNRTEFMLPLVLDKQYRFYFFTTFYRFFLSQILTKL